METCFRSSQELQIHQQIRSSISRSAHVKVDAGPGHRIKTHRNQKSVTTTMIRQQNADTMVLASVLMGGIPPWMTVISNIIKGVNASHKRTG
jgi:hypothetical protein